MNKKKVIYGINDKPKLSVAIPLGLQHVLTLFGATTLVPLILGPAIFNGNSLEIAKFISNVYFCMGIATIVQLFFGSRLPIVQGSSFAFLTPIFAIITIVNAKNAGQSIDSSNLIMQTLAGSLIVGGLLEAIIGYSGLVGKLKKIITPVVIGPTIMLIGFSLFDVAVEMNAAKYWPISLLVVIGIFYFSLLHKGRLRLFPVLLSVLLVYILCIILSVTNVFDAAHPAYVNFNKIHNADFFEFPKPFKYGFPVFDLSAIFAMLAAFLASMIESIGDYHSVSYASGLDDPAPETISKGIGAEGIGCILSGIFGSSGTTSYTENIGLINITGVASRFVVFIGALILIFLSFFTKIGAAIAIMPSPIIGGAYIALFGVIGALGIQTLTRCDLNSQRNLMIIGFSFLMGLGVGKWMPGFFKANPDLLGISALGKLGWNIIGSIFSTPMAVGAISGLFLDNIIPGTNEERGIK